MNVGAQNGKVWLKRLAGGCLRIVVRLMFPFRRAPRLDDAALRAATSFLLIRPEGLGDIVLTMPAIACLRGVNARAKIAMAVRPMFAEFVRDIGIVDEVVVLDFPKRSTLQVGKLGQFLAQVWSLRGRYDVAWDFRGDPRNAILGALAARIVAGAPAHGTEFLLSAVHAGLPNTPAAERNLEIVAVGTGGRPTPKVEEYAGSFDYRMREEVGERARRLRGGWKDYIVVHPSASRPSNQWGVSRWREVIRGLTGDGENVVISGSGGGDEQAVREILEGVEGNGRVLNLVNRTTCSELAVLVGEARALISPDTGVAHIAFARGVPSVTLFGSDSESTWGHPTRVNRQVFATLPCRPCRAYWCPRTDRPGECMDLISVEAVRSSLRAALKGEPAADAEGQAGMAKETAR